jgi:hypothetical protein
MLLPIASLAKDAGESAESTRQAGEDRWVPSLAITSGVSVQKQNGTADSCLFPGDTSPDSCNSKLDLPLRGFVKGNDTAVSPFVGGTLELMAPALSIPTRPRLFVSGEILPTFATDRDLVVEGDPGCVRGPNPGAPCAKNEEEGSRKVGFGQNEANGQGTTTSAEIDTLVFGASLGVAFPLQIGKRQLRIKPSVGWINYKVEAEALVVDAACNPTDLCTNATNESAFGYLRERTLSASGSQRFNGIGPGLDVEMDTGRYGPLGVSLFMGARAYAIVDDRKISFGTEKFYPEAMRDPEDPLYPGIVFGPETGAGRFEVEVDRWIYRAHVGIRFHWLGSEE